MKGTSVLECISVIDRNMLFVGIRQLLTLVGVKECDGRHIDQSHLNIIEDGAFVVKDGEFHWVGRRSDIPNTFKDLKTIDLKGADVLPGFIDCHTHTVFAGDRSDEFERRNLGETYQDIAASGGGIWSTVQSTRQASEEELLALGQQRVDRFLSQGVTTLEIKSGYGLNTDDELKILEVISKLKPMRIVPTYLGPHTVPKEFKSAHEYMDHILSEQGPAVIKQGIAKRADIFIERGYFDLEQARQFLNWCHTNGLSVAVHTDQLSRLGGVPLALELGAFSVDHCVEISEGDIEGLANSQATTVLLPAADFYLNTPYPPARKLLDRGVRVALATDFNPGSSPTQDLSFIGVLSRCKMGLTLPEVLAGFTWNASYALGLGDRVGCIKEEMSADFIVLKESWQKLFLEIGTPMVHQVWFQGQKIY